ncbi:hypothetical protein [Poseidonibacter antarcticus]|uniref:hypothetical protein n=1 Tax=Poseidonibacter antarcticus TaxID=2478538 RepID=UPI000EF49096|nr:hypothetical protein [Poseidonibacter antarcticus]
MNIELRFLQKAIKDKNYISFTYKNKKYIKIRPLKLITKNTYVLKTSVKDFNFELITRIQILKEKF